VSRPRSSAPLPVLCPLKSPIAERESRAPHLSLYCIIMYRGGGTHLHFRSFYQNQPQHGPRLLLFTLSPFLPLFLAQNRLLSRRIRNELPKIFLRSPLRAWEGKGSRSLVGPEEESPILLQLHGMGWEERRRSSRRGHYS
jgi:hypothetical protein